MNRLDLIIDALELASYVPRGVMYPAGYPMQIAQALAAARELKALNPVAWITKGGEGELWWYQSVDENGDNNPKDVALYALDGEQA